MFPCKVLNKRSYNPAATPGHRLGQIVEYRLRRITEKDLRDAEGVEHGVKTGRKRSRITL